jgi:hypothetical protein
VAERSNMRSKAKNLARDMTWLPFCRNLPITEGLMHLYDA